MECKLKEIVEIDFSQFENKINNKETFIFYFGGTWCKNCRVINPLIEEVAEKNYTTIFNLDSRVGNKDSVDDFRKCNTIEQEIQYKKIIDLLNYENEESVMVEDEFFNLRDTKIPKLSVPSIFGIKKGIVVGIILEEYEEETITIEDIKYFKNELYELIKKISHH
ncbi:MAG: thioredoxin family protein [bacterium]